MIQSPQDFYRLRTSVLPAEYQQSMADEAPIAVWRNIIEAMPDMRKWVALNKTVPIEILEVLVEDDRVEVRHTVAMKRKLPERLQLKLVSDPDASVRQRLAYNAKATKRVLETLARDSEVFVRERAIERLAGSNFALESSE